MENPLSFFRRLGQELYSLPKERPLAALGLAMFAAGATAYISGTEICRYANAWIEPFNTISQIGEYVFCAGALVWTADVFRRARGLARI